MAFTQVTTCLGMVHNVKIAILTLAKTLRNISAQYLSWKLTTFGIEFTRLKKKT